MSQPPKAPQSDPVVNDKNLYLCFQHIKNKKFDEAKVMIQTGLDQSVKAGEAQAEALYLSAMGVLFKVQGDYRQSYKFYQKAEKLLPDDPSLKIISATLLIEEFAQYDTAFRKLDKILKSGEVDPAILHHAKVLSGLARLCTGKKNEAIKILEDINSDDFLKMRSATNINFRLVENLAEKRLATEVCTVFLKKALDLAVQKRELAYQEAIRNLLKQM